jgi:hypothetical protein
MPALPHVQAIEMQVGRPERDEILASLAPTNSWIASEKQSIAFAKSTLRFKENLDRVRNKHQRRKDTSISATLTGFTSTTEIKHQEGAASSSTANDRPVRVLRVVQHTLTSIVSIMIATLQSLTYVKYQKTKDVPGAWPLQPTLFPTLILLAVAAMGLAFDICSLIAYLMPHRRIAQRAFRLAVRLHYWITGIKTLSYVVAAAVCRAGYDMGDGKDLWGWSCSKQGEEMNNINDAKGNCAGNVSVTRKKACSC